MHLLFWPFLFLIGLLGKLIAGILGFVLLIVGVILCFTIIGAIIGIPLAIVGLLLLIKAIF